MVGVGLAFLLELLDRTVKDNRFVTETLDFTILGTVPQMSAKELKQATKLAVNKSAQSTTNSSTTKEQSRRSRSRV